MVFHGHRLVCLGSKVGFSWLQVGFSWLEVVFHGYSSVFHGSRSDFMVPCRFFMVPGGFHGSRQVLNCSRSVSMFFLFVSFMFFCVL